MQPLFGIRAHDFGTLPIEELAPKIAASGAKTIQLALAKALPGEKLLPSDFTESEFASIKQTLDANGIGIAVIGCYIDTVTPDLDERAFNIRRFKEHIDYAHKLGCRYIGTETGSPIPYLQKDPVGGKAAAFKVATETLREIIRYAETKDVTLSIEAVEEYHAMQTADQIKFLIDEFNSPNLGVIFDPVNLTPVKGVEDIDAFLDHCFNCFGDKIIAIHAKDYRLEETPEGIRKSKDLPAGFGSLDWCKVFKRVKQYNKSHVPILLEETSPETAKQSFAYLLDAWNRA
ncbi:MAG: sugar phosphate isomerase/epimerase family protein [Cellvibrio sp.]